MFWYMYTWGNVLPTREPVNKYSKELPISLFVEIRPHSKFQVYSTVLLSVVPSLYISRTNPLLNGSHVRICWPSYTWMITKPVFPRPEISGQGVAKLCLKETLCCLSRCLSFAIKIHLGSHLLQAGADISHRQPYGATQLLLDIKKFVYPPMIAIFHGVLRMRTYNVPKQY